MLRINTISLTQFRNYAQKQFTFHERVVGICGNNGLGKTNLLDAIYYACFTQSYFSKSDARVVRQGSEGFRLEAAGSCGEKDFRISVIVRETGQKELRVDDEIIPKRSSYIGRFPAVMVCPDDTLLITGASEERRRYMDILFAQLDAGYLQDLLQYNRVIQQRNSYLKQTAPPQAFDAALLDSYDQQLAPYGQRIFEKRKNYLEKLIPQIEEYYERLAGGREGLALSYQSPLYTDPYPDLLRAHREKDRFAQRTLTGIHRDEIDFLLSGLPVKSVGSQGQRKSLLFACKLAEWKCLRDEKGFAPLLLLDDVFEKLDDQRMQHLLKMVCLENDGQVFMTDTHPGRMEQYFQKLQMPMQMIVLDKP